MQNLLESEQKKNQELELKMRSKSSQQIVPEKDFYSPTKNTSK